MLPPGEAVFLKRFKTSPLRLDEPTVSYQEESEDSYGIVHIAVFPSALGLNALFQGSLSSYDSLIRIPKKISRENTVNHAKSESEQLTFSVGCLVVLRPGGP